MKAEFSGSAGVSQSNWSNPANWVSGQDPVSSPRLHVQIDSNSTEDLGTAQAPFVTDDIVGAAIGLSSPTLTVTGFLHARAVANLQGLTLIGSGRLDAYRIENVRHLTTLASHTSLQVRDDIANVQQLTATEESIVHVRGDLVDVQSASVSFGATLEVGHDFGATKFAIGAAGGKLIFDHPEHGCLTNPISLAAGNDTIELGKLLFDKADFLPSAPGSSTCEMQLTEHGHTVYQLTDVTLSFGPTAPTLTVGVDKSTGFHFVNLS